jgi:hypothetical protein
MTAVDPLSFHRPPRAYPAPVPAEPLRVAAPPTEQPPIHSSVLQVLMPLVGGVGLVGFAVVYRNTTFLYVPVGGTLVGAGVGALAGLAAGAAASAWQPGKRMAADAGEWVANAAVDTGKRLGHAAENTWNWSGDRIHDVQHGLDVAKNWAADRGQDIEQGLDTAKDWAANRGEDVAHGLDTAKDWVSDHIPHPDLPDLSLF